MKKVGVLALQGDFEAHAKLLDRAGATPVEVRTADELRSVDALVIPGGESTTIGKLATEYELVEPLRERAQSGIRILGTCAGMIVCARRITEGDQPLLGIVDITVRRNAYGRQVDSFETDLDVDGIGTMHAVFIRAPWIEEVGAGVEVLATHRGHPVVLRDRNVTLASFHPELADDDRLHRFALGL
ncbi:MAG: pyridoxal 5'-phosphate synthase glutaminase subunit PdxT [Actinomycetota bacterium]